MTVVIEIVDTVFPLFVLGVLDVDVETGHNRFRCGCGNCYDIILYTSIGIVINCEYMFLSTKHMALRNHQLTFITE